VTGPFISHPWALDELFIDHRSSIYSSIDEPLIDHRSAGSRPFIINHSSTIGGQSPVGVVHATLGIRAGLLAGGRIPRIPWTS
jgi:hypothetical protein